VRSADRDETISIVIHICMETTQGNSLCSYLYLKLAKMHVFLIIFYVFFFSYKIREQEGRTGSVLGERGLAQMEGGVVGKGIGG
jgi:hypothetical protein